MSKLREIKIGVPQVSILGPLLFIIFINDFAKISDKFIPLLFGDDTALLFEADSPQQLQKLLDEELPKVYRWLQANKLSLNTQKTYCQVYHNFKKNANINVTLAGEKINEVETVKYLGVFIDKNMKWNSHITHISKIISRNIGIINRSKYFLSNQHRYLLYNSLILPYLNYCSLLWGCTQKTLLNKLIILQKKIVRIVDNQPKLAHTSPIFAKLEILKLEDLVKQQAIVVMHNIITQRAPTPILSLFEVAQESNRASRGARHFSELFTSKLYCTRTIVWIGPRLWNALIAPRFPQVSTLPTAKSKIKALVKQLMIQEY